MNKSNKLICCISVVETLIKYDKVTSRSFISRTESVTIFSGERYTKRRFTLINLFSVINSDIAESLLIILYGIILAIRQRQNILTGVIVDYRIEQFAIVTSLCDMVTHKLNLCTVQLIHYHADKQKISGLTNRTFGIEIVPFQIIIIERHNFGIIVLGRNPQSLVGFEDFLPVVLDTASRVVIDVFKFLHIKYSLLNR